IRAGPLDRVDSREALIVFRVVPELVTFAGGGVGDPERQRVAALKRRIEQPGPLLDRSAALPFSRSASCGRASTSSRTTTAAASTAKRSQRVVCRTVRIADAPRALMRLLT